jgi:hypothetical protein
MARVNYFRRLPGLPATMRAVPCGLDYREGGAGPIMRRDYGILNLEESPDSRALRGQDKPSLLPGAPRH